MVVSQHRRIPIWTISYTVALTIGTSKIGPPPSIFSEASCLIHGRRQGESADAGNAAGGLSVKGEKEGRVQALGAIVRK